MFGQATANSLHIEYHGNAVQSHSSISRLSTRKPLFPGSRKSVPCFSRPEKVVSSCSCRQQISGKQCRPFSLISSKPTARSHRSGSALRASAPETATQESNDLGLTVVPPADSTASAPILSGAGGGIFFWWQLGKQFTHRFLECPVLQA